MALVRRVYQACGICGQNGYLESTTQAPGQEPVVSQQVCPNCNGLKYYLWGWVTDSTFDSDTEIANLG